MLEEYHEKNTNGFYDWYVVGGRWTGAHDGYEPYLDVRNFEICNLCKGTGRRHDWDEPSLQSGSGGSGNNWSWADQCRGCNACNGTGVKEKFHSVPHPEDVLPLTQVKDDLKCCTLIVVDHFKKNVHHDMGHQAVKEFLKKKYKITGGHLITVDYHN